jgi:hypothetical protein
VALVDPGTEPYKPTKGKVNVLMAVGIQVCYHCLDFWTKLMDREQERQRRVLRYATLLPKLKAGLMGSLPSTTRGEDSRHV